MKITIDNKSSSIVTIRGRHSFSIPANGTLETDIPDNPRSRAMLARLRREYPAMRITVEKAAPAPAAEPAAAAEPADNGDTAPNAPAPQAPEGALTAEAFASFATAEKGDAGWWTVTMEDGETYKVRGAKDGDAAIEMAYASYLESVTAA